MDKQTTTVTETISRRVVKALMSQFSSVADAVSELVDNPIDYHEGQRVEVVLTFDRKRQRIIVESDGGRGMSPADIQTFLNWGDGEHHKASDIGCYGQGGKAACGFLARDLRMYAKAKDSSEVYMIEDIGWAERPHTKTFELAPIKRESLPDTVRGAKKSRGHVRIELNHANMDRRWNIDVLKRQLASTYAKMLASGGLVIILNGETLQPFTIPLDPSVETIHLETSVRGVTLKGWAGKLDRQATKGYDIRSGLRLFSKGRLIKDGEWFGYNWQSKGALNQLIGELEIDGLTPNLNKTDYTERNDHIWAELSTEVVSWLAPLIGRLRVSSEDVRVTKVEQERAASIRAELSRVIQELAEEGNTEVVEVIGPGGRKKPEPREEPWEKKEFAPTGRKNQPRTPPPPDAVGSLMRVLGHVHRGKFPDIEIRSWDSTERATIDGQTVVVNKAHPMYLDTHGGKSYVAETVVLELLAKDPETPTPQEYLDRVNNIMFRWHDHQVALV